MSSMVTPNRAIVFAVGAFVFYWILATFLPATVLRDIFNSLAFGTAIIITFTWFPAAVRAIREEADSGAWQLILGITVIWMVVMFQRIYAIAYNYFNRPQVWAESAVTGFWPYSFFIAGLLFLTAPGVKEAGIHKRAVFSIVFSIALGSFFAGILIGTQIGTEF